MKTAHLTRKKPIQSRSQITLNSLQEAFVRVLIDRGYEKMTIREVVSVAGVGIGTFYDYIVEWQRKVSHYLQPILSHRFLNNLA